MKSLKKLNKKYKEIKNSKLWIGFVIIISFIISLIFEKTMYSNSNIIRIILFSVITEFIGLHLYIDIKKLWDFIYKYRYYIGITIFALLVAGGFNGSSVKLYDYYIEPNTIAAPNNPILGLSRDIRSDEWIVSTPSILSQASPLNNFSKISVTGNAVPMVVSFYPKKPSKTFSILSCPKYLGFLFLPLENAFSFYWYFNLFALLFISFEFFMILTKNKLWSLAGAILLGFGASTQWWYSTPITTIIYSGFGALCLFYAFLKSKKTLNKILYSVGIGIFGASFIQTLYPAWMVPFAYIYLAFIIYFISKEYKNTKWYEYVYMVLIVIGVIGIILIPSAMESMENIQTTMNTTYPGARLSQGGSGFEHLFDYIISLALPFISFSNASEASQYLSFYPIPIFLGIYVIIQNIKNKKHDILLDMLVLISIFLSLWNFIKLPLFISRISFLYMSTEFRSTVVVSFLCVVLIVYLFGTEKIKLEKNYLLSITTSLLLSALGTYIMMKMYPEANNDTLIIGFICIVSIFTFMLLNYNNLKIKNILPIALIVITLINGFMVNPLNRGVSVFYEKPSSKKIASVLEEKPEATWVSVDSPIYYSSYLLANNVKTLNSVSYFPNMKMWNIIDPDKKFEDSWNRYAHITVTLTNNETSVDLLQADYFDLKLNTQDACNLNINYLFSSNGSLESLSSKTIDIKKIYENENVFIYEYNCS